MEALLVTQRPACCCQELNTLKQTNKQPPPSPEEMKNALDSLPSGRGGGGGWGSPLLGSRAERKQIKLAARAVAGLSQRSKEVIYRKIPKTKVDRKVLVLEAGL